MTKGKYIVIEGAQGVGKSTMVSMLAERLRANHTAVHVMREPDSQNDLTAHTIRRITQSPEYPMNTRTEVLLYNAARSQSLEIVRDLRENGVTCLVDHNYLTTLAIQYYGRGDVQEYQKINDIIAFAVGDMEPDLTIVLDAPVATLRERTAHRYAGERFDNLDEAFLERVRAGYLWEANQRGLPVVYASEGVDTVFQNIWQYVTTLMSQRDGAPSTGPQSVAELLAASPAAKAAAVEPPITLKSAGENTPASSTKHPAKQAASRPIVVADASNLVVEALAHGRLASYAELSVLPTVFDQKDANDHYHFFIPTELHGKLRSQYIRTMNQLFDTYAQMLTDVTTHIRTASSVPVKKRDTAWQDTTRAHACDALRPLLPVAAKSAVEVHASSRALKHLAARLLDDDLSEIRTHGQQLLKEMGAPETNTTQDMYQTRNRAGLRKLADSLLPPNHTPENNPVTLVQYTPRNELDTVADMLYAHSDLPLATLHETTALWSYQQKAAVFTTYVGGRATLSDLPGRALEGIHYHFDLTCSYDTFRILQRHRVVEGLERQPLSPRLGYDVPALVEEAGTADAYEQCFDLSLQLYSALQGGGHPLEAQYATLLGHKLRWHVIYSAREAFRIHELHANSQINPDTRQLVQYMHAAIAEVHPMIAEAMSSVQPPLKT